MLYQRGRSTHAYPAYERRELQRRTPVHRSTRTQVPSDLKCYAEVAVVCISLQMTVFHRDYGLPMKGDYKPTFQKSILSDSLTESGDPE